MRYVLMAVAAVTTMVGTARAAPGAITYAVIGDIDPNGKVPALNGVPGAGVANVDVPIPLYVLAGGSAYAITVGTQNNSFAGSCTVSYTLTAVIGGTKTTLGSATTQPYNCGKGTTWAWAFNTPALPNFKGAATLTATATFGSTTVTRNSPLTVK